MMIRNDCDLHVRVSRELKDMLYSAAEARGMKPNDLVRFLMFNYFERRGAQGEKEVSRG